LSFRLVGDPTDQTVGFQYSAPYYLGDLKDIARKHDETLSMILIGGYLLIAVYHFLLFAMRRHDVHNLFYGLFSALMGFYYLFRTRGIYHYLPDTALVVKAEFFCIFLVIPALGAFAETLCVGRISKITKLYSAFFAFLAVSQALLPRPYGSDALIVWQFAGIAALGHILVNNIFRVFIREVRAGRRQHAQYGDKAPGLVHFLAETYAGNLLIGVSAFVLSSTVDIIDSLFFHYSLELARYSLFLFVLAVTLMLARVYGRLNNALEAKRIFLANMSHEIRTPLNAIMGTVEQIARERPSDEAVLAKVERVRRAGGILISIINDILDFSRLEAGKMMIVNREYRFRSLIDEVTDLISMQLTGKEIAFAARIDPAIPETLVGDALRIRQILLNLLWNAVKFTGRGKIDFSVALKDQGPPPVIVFKVTDTGSGIQRENLGKIFTEFYRLDGKSQQGPEGTGLGLSICKNLCILMGGEIGVHSEYG
jgi:signal transduction histidine kinase